MTEWKNWRKRLGNWLLLGLAAGFLFAAAVTYMEYRAFSGLAGSLVRQGTEESTILAAALKDQEPSDREAGQAWLEEYGYRVWGRLGENVGFAVVFFVLISEAAGGVLLLSRRKEEKRRSSRIEGLSRYLLAAQQGQACILQRREDEFSFLEDEIYKVVAQLTSTKEEAVRNHEVLSERIADVAHQLKTPLASMSLMAELLEEQQTEESREYWERLTAQIGRLQNLVSALLSLARLETHTIRYKMEKIDLEGLAEEAAEPLREMIRKKHIRMEFSGAPVSVTADRQWTGEAVLNVLKNCAEHSREGGLLRVEWSENPFYAQLQVTDSGNGISRKDLPHLFERFYRGQDAGPDSAGIGLALAKLVMEQQNGCIRAENTPDGHARFCLRFYRVLSGSTPEGQGR